MPPTCPTEIVTKNVAVLALDGGQVSGTADSLRAVAETDRRQSANVGTKGNSRKVLLLRHIDVVVQIKAVRVQVVETEAEFVDQIRAKRVNLAGRQAARGVLAVPVLKAPAIEHVIKRRGQEVFGVSITEAGEEIVFLTYRLVDADIELVICFASLRIGEKGVVAKLGRIRSRKKRRQPRRQRIIIRGRKDIGRHSP